MKIVLGPGCDKAWRDSLSWWQHRQLARLYRNEDDGMGPRFRQKGVRTHSQNGLLHRRATCGHERIVVMREDYGFRVIGIHRECGFAFDPETGEVSEVPEHWTITWVDYCYGHCTANFPPERTPPGWRD